LSERELLIVAACALIDADGRILMTQRPMGKSHAGQWEFPGGKVETGETPEQAVTRELREELSIEPCALSVPTMGRLCESFRGSGLKVGFS